MGKKQLKEVVQSPCCWPVAVICCIIYTMTKFIVLLFLWFPSVTTFWLFYHVLHLSCRTCEICHSIASNVAVINEAETTEQPNEAETAMAVPAIAAPTAPPSETQHFWQGRRFLNFLLACMIFAFVISWLFHFNVRSYWSILVRET